MTLASPPYSRCAAAQTSLLLQVGEQYLRFLDPLLLPAAARDEPAAQQHLQRARSTNAASRQLNEALQAWHAVARGRPPARRC